MSESLESVFAAVRAEAVERNDEWVVEMIDAGKARITRAEARRTALLREFRDVVSAGIKAAHPYRYGTEDLAWFVTGQCALFLMDLMEGRWEPTDVNLPAATPALSTEDRE